MTSTAGIDLHDAFQYLDATGARHYQIEEDHPGPQPQKHFESLFRIL